MSTTAQHDVYTRKDGSTTAYEVLGKQNTYRQPIVLVSGLSMVRGDWERLIGPLSEDRQVLIFDNRGMGQSTFSSQGNEVLSIELMARDLLDLLTFLEWKEVTICGFSMGGLIAQHLLFLPYVDINPVSLPFQVKHLILAGTLTGPKNKEKGLKLSPPPALKRPPTREEIREFGRPLVEAAFDPTWFKDPAKASRINWWLDRMAGRPFNIIEMQARAMDALRMEQYYPRLSSDVKVLVIHGKLDRTVPFSYSRDILNLIPWAKMVEVGTRPGQVETLEFGHNWFEYFDTNVWKEVITRFTDESTGGGKAHL